MAQNDDDIIFNQISILDSEMLEEKSKNPIDILKDRIKKEHDSVNKNIKEMSGNMISAIKLANNKHRIYSYRQELLSIKRNYSDEIASLQKTIKKTEYEVLVLYKTGKKSVTPSNDMERKICLDSELKEHSYIMNLLKNHLQFIIDSSDNVISMSYGIEAIIKLEEFMMR